MEISKTSGRDNPAIEDVGAFLYHSSTTVPCIEPCKPAPSTTEPSADLVFWNLLVYGTILYGRSTCNYTVKAWGRWALSTLRLSTVLTIPVVLTVVEQINGGRTVVSFVGSWVARLRVTAAEASMWESHATYSSTMAIPYRIRVVIWENMIRKPHTLQYLIFLSDIARG
jgi:hypothetical protein